MKIKLLSLAIALSALVLFSCEKNPQKEAERQAQTEQNKADHQADEAQKDYDKAMGHAQKALDFQSQADVSAAIAGVDVPQLSNGTANEFVKKVGNDVTALAKSDSYTEGGKYIDALQADVAELKEKVAKGSISSEDATQIEGYVQSLASALGVTVTVAEEEAAPAN